MVKILQSLRHWTFRDFDEVSGAVRVSWTPPPYTQDFLAHAAVLRKTIRCPSRVDHQLQTIDASGFGLSPRTERRRSSEQTTNQCQASSSPSLIYIPQTASDYDLMAILRTAQRQGSRRWLLRHQTRFGLFPRAAAAAIPACVAAFSCGIGLEPSTRGCRRRARSAPCAGQLNHRTVGFLRVARDFLSYSVLLGWRQVLVPMPGVVSWRRLCYLHHTTQE